MLLPNYKKQERGGKGVGLTFADHSGTSEN
jgi:hypothetical protein